MIEAARLDLFANKGSKFEKEFQYIDHNGNPIPLTNKRVRAVIKESVSTTVKSFDQILEIMDEALGMFKWHICAEDTEVELTFAEYYILVESTLDDEECETIKIVYGTFEFREGTN